MPQWKDAPELMELATPIIEKHHEHLVGCPIRFVWRSPARKMGKKHVALGTAEVISGRFAWFVMNEEEKELAANFGLESPRMFWIEISADDWQDLTEPQRLALIDHELCHCGVEWTEDDPEPELHLIRHDVEEFEAILRRHGAWEVGLERFAAALMGFEGV